MILTIYKLSMSIQMISPRLCQPQDSHLLTSQQPTLELVLTTQQFHSPSAEEKEMCQEKMITYPCLKRQ